MTQHDYSTLHQLLIAVLSALSGGGGVHFWKRWRNGRNGGRVTVETEKIIEAIRQSDAVEVKGHKDIEKAIREEGKETRGVLREHIRTINELRVDVAKKRGSS